MRQRCASVRTFSTLLMRLYSSHFVFEAPPPKPHVRLFNSHVPATEDTWYPPCPTTLKQLLVGTPHTNSLTAYTLTMSWFGTPHFGRALQTHARHEP